MGKLENINFKNKEKMKAAFITERPAIGELTNKIHLDATFPPPQNIEPTEIIVQVKAFSINVDDIHVAEGSFLGGIPGLQRKHSSTQSPLVIGSDFAGIIATVGSKVTKFKVGQRVCGMNKQQSIYSEMGTWAEYTVTQSKNIVAIPDHVSFQDAAAVVLPLFVIHGLLEIKPKLKANERVVVIGASGGIGSLLISILRSLSIDNLHITGICS